MVKKQVDSRSYMVETPKDHTLRRNPQHLLHTNKKPFDLQDEVDEEGLEIPCHQIPTLSQWETIRDSTSPRQAPTTTPRQC